jgi:hypothetical protein
MLDPEPTPAPDLIDSPVSSEGERSGLDAVVSMYQKGIDVTLIRENLRRTPAERLRNHQALMHLAEELREAGQRARRIGT